MRKIITLINVSNKQDNILIGIKSQHRLELKFNKILLKKLLIIPINHKKQSVKINLKLLNKTTILNIIKIKHQSPINLMIPKISITNLMLKQPKPNNQNKLKLKNQLQVNNKDSNNLKSKQVNKILNKNNKKLKLEQESQLRNNQLKRKVRHH